MEKKIKPGLKRHDTETVTFDKTAASYESGTLEIYATPSMISFMERTCLLSVEDYLPKEQTTVGTLVNIKHIKASKTGEIITCKSELVEIDRRRLVFKVESNDSEGLIGHGIHERFIVDVDKFLGKIN
ncbi:MAG: thioesterase family protein [Bacteroidales bacterium]|nr:thioesterase family protein [Bacteroidales bacterium]